MNSVEKLTEIETRLRQPQTDKKYLASQLQVLAAIIAHDGENESGLISGAIGGMIYSLERLRDIWHKGETPPKSFDELKEMFALVELSRYAMSEDVVEETKKKLLADAMMARIHEIELSDGTKVSVFASDRDQRTVDGIPVARGEMLEASSTMVPSFQAYYQHLRKENKVGSV